MNNISRFNGCSNCGACLNICPTNAIAVDNGGLFYKVGVNEKKCVDCGRCVEVCPWNNERGVQNLSAAYGGFSKDKEIVAKSSSGGIFSAVADLILKKDGVVFGAVYSKDRHSVIFGSTDEFDLDEIRRSKYTESFVGNTFSEIKNILKAGFTPHIASKWGTSKNGALSGSGCRITPCTAMCPETRWVWAVPWKNTLMRIRYFNILRRKMCRRQNFPNLTCSSPSN